MAIENACHSHPWTLKTMSSCIGGRYFNLAAFDSDILVGFYIGEKAGPDFTLMDICVTPEHQGKGIAKQLLSKFIEHGEQQNAENLFLEVRESNTRAIKLYRASWVYRDVGSERIITQVMMQLKTVLKMLF